MSNQVQIFDGVHPEILGDLHTLVLDRAARERGVGSNNVGGWKSNEGFLDSPITAVRVLLVHLTTRLGRRPLGWAMVNRNGSAHKRHRHGLTYQCGVYYVTAGDPAVPTVFDVAGGELAVDPMPGRLVLFPGSVWHRVPRYDGLTPRISIAFEVRS